MNPTRSSHPKMVSTHLRLTDKETKTHPTCKSAKAPLCRPDFVCRLSVTPGPGREDGREGSEDQEPKRQSHRHRSLTQGRGRRTSRRSGSTGPAVSQGVLGLGVYRPRGPGAQGLLPWTPHLLHDLALLPVSGARSRNRVTLFPSAQQHWIWVRSCNE